MTTASQAEVRYAHAEVEAKWQAHWAGDGLYAVRDDDPRPKWYELTMYPYPSGDLHVGHWYAMSPSDAHARFRAMQGYNVLHPMGFDAFGLPAENAAISRGVHPYRWTMSNIENMRRQLRTMGPVYDWDREVVTCDPDYYRWNQWFFLQFLKSGLAYRAFAPANWCPSCNTVLANEQVVDQGNCERCGSAVSRRDLNQWFFRITRYADELLDHSKIDWPEKVVTMQKNWIGRSKGVEIEFDISEYGLEESVLKTFTTRIDTIFGVTFVVLAPEHPLVESLTTPEHKAEVQAYVEQARRQSEVERLSTEKEKTGVFTGSFCVNRLNGERVPILVADYVLLTYGTGVVMGVPAHDQRDFEFAKKYDLPIKVVIAPDGWQGEDLHEAYLDEGSQVNSGQFDGLPSADGWQRIADHVEESGCGRARRGLPDEGLAHLAPALLGHAHTHHTLRRLRRCPRARRRPARAAAGGRPVPAHRRVPAQVPRGVHRGRLSPSAARPPGASPTRWTRSSTLPGTSYGSPAPTHELGRLRPRGRPRLEPGRPVHRRRRARSDAPALRALLRQGASGPRHAGLRRALHAALQPGPHHRQQPEDEQVAR